MSVTLAVKMQSKTMTLDKKNFAQDKRMYCFKKWQKLTFFLKEYFLNFFFKFFFTQNHIKV